MIELDCIKCEIALLNLKINLQHDAVEKAALREQLKGAERRLEIIDANIFNSSKVKNNHNNCLSGLYADVENDNFDIIDKTSTNISQLNGILILFYLIYTRHL